MTSDRAQRGGGGVWRRCNFQISKIVDSSIKGTKEKADLSFIWMQRTAVKRAKKKSGTWFAV